MKTLSILVALVITAIALYAADGQPPPPQAGSPAGMAHLGAIPQKHNLQNLQNPLPPAGIL